MVVHARGDVHGFDDAHKLELRARTVDFDRRSREAMARGEPELLSRDDHDRITVLRGTTLHVNTRTRVAEAIDSVSVSRDTLNARGQFARFDDESGRGYLLGNPRVWDDQTSVSGDTLEFWSEKRVLTKVRVVGHALMNYTGLRPGTVGEASQLKGDVAEVFIGNDKIDSLVATGSASNEYRGVPQPARPPRKTVPTATPSRCSSRTGRSTARWSRARPRASTDCRCRSATRWRRSAKWSVTRRRASNTWCRRAASCSIDRRTSRTPISSCALTASSTTSTRRRWWRTARRCWKRRAKRCAGQLMTYDLPSHVGTIYQAETEYEKGLYRGGTHSQVGRQQARCAERLVHHLRSARAALSLRVPLHEDLSQGQAGGEAGGVLREERAAVRVAVLRLSDQARPALGVSVSADRVRVQPGQRPVHPQRRLLLGTERLLRHHRRGRLLPGRAIVGDAR